MSHYVTGWTDIASVFGVTGKAVRSWQAMGAPVLSLGSKPVTRLDSLWEWLVENREQVETGRELGTGAMSAAQAKALVGDSGRTALMAAVLSK